LRLGKRAGKEGKKGEHEVGRERKGEGSEDGQRERERERETRRKRKEPTHISRKL